MPTLRWIACFAWLLLVTGCHSRPVGNEAPAKMERIQVADDNHGFVTAASGRPFVAWGFNYDRDYRMRLLEEYWQTEWPTVVEDFREMKRLGANVVRVHLQLHQFMQAPGVPNQRNLEQLERLLRLAEETRLYLDLTGLACYRRTNVPPWYDSLTEPQRWQVQAEFWEVVAARCSASPAVFCYDLMNEPVVPSGKRAAGDWLTGDLAGFTYVQFISLDQAGRPRAAIAREWIAKLSAAIRKNDRHHLITVGLLPNSPETEAFNSGFAPQLIAPEISYVSVHLYPKSGRLSQDLALLRRFQVGKPVVVEELFPLQCQASELKEFIRQSRAYASGWIGFYWGQTPSELSRSADPGAALTREWLRTFSELSP